MQRYVVCVRQHSHMGVMQRPGVGSKTCRAATTRRSVYGKKQPSPHQTQQPAHFFLVHHALAVSTRAHAGKTMLLPRVMPDCEGISTTISFSVWTYLMLSMNGIKIRSPCNTCRHTQE